MERKVGMKTLVAYGLGDMYGGGAFMIVGLLFLFYLTEVVGLSPALAGLVFGIGKVWDAVSDPLMGYLSDRTRSRYGRRRVYFLAGIVPIAVSFIIMWLPLKTESQALLFLYYSFAYVVFATVFTMVMIPYSALAAELSADYEVRNRLSGSRLLFSGFSSLLAATVPKIIIDSSSGPPSAGYVTMSIVFGIFFALPWIITFFGTWEDDRAMEESYAENFLKEFLSIFKNRSFNVHIMMYVCAYSAIDFLMALFTYYLTYYLRRDGIYSIAMGTLMLVQLAMIVFYVRMSNTKGKRLAYQMGMIIWFGGMFLTLALTSTSPIALICLVCAVIGSGTAAAVYIPYAILPNVIDVDELMTGRQRSGVYSGALTLMRKLVQGALVMPMIGFFLQLVGFVSHAEQTPQVLTRFFIFFIGGSALLIAAGIIIAFFFHLNVKNSTMLTAELERLRSGGTLADASEEMQQIGEQLTGQKWTENNWP